MKAEKTMNKIEDEEDSSGWGGSDPSDGREQGEYKSRYPKKVRCCYWVEAIYLFLILSYSFFGVLCFLNTDLVFWPLGFTIDNLAQQLPLKRYLALCISGLMGGAMFGIKYLYHVVGRGWWHFDRGIWRIFSPWLAACLAGMIGILFEAGLLNYPIDNNNSSVNPYLKFLGLGFLFGYFADTAQGKLQELVTVIMGTKSEKK